MKFSIQFVHKLINVKYQTRIPANFEILWKFDVYRFNQGGFISKKGFSAWLFREIMISLTFGSCNA